MYPDQSALPAQNPTNPLAITSLIASVVGWVLGGLGSCGFFFLFAPMSLCTGLVFVIGCLVGVVTGHMATGQIQASGQAGKGLAMTGLVLGWIGVGMVILSVCLGLLAIVALALMGPAIGNVFSNIIIDI
jgi:hypothetical protein